MIGGQYGKIATALDILANGNVHASPEYDLQVGTARALDDDANQLAERIALAPSFFDEYAALCVEDKSVVRRALCEDQYNRFAGMDDVVSAGLAMVLLR